MSGVIIYWAGTTVPMSRVHYPYSALTARLYREWTQGPKPAIRTLSQMTVHPSLWNKIERWAEKLGEQAAKAINRGSGLGLLPPVDPVARLNSADLAPLREAYPGQAYFHAHNLKIRRAEKSFFGAGLC